MSRYEYISSLISKHIDIMNQIVLKTDFLSHKVKGSNIYFIEKNIENRERMINHLKELQGKIRSEANKLEDGNLKESIEKDIQSWQNKISICSNKIKKLDECLIISLNQMKEKVQNEISQLFQLKSKFKGYNLNMTIHSPVKSYHKDKATTYDNN